MRAFHITCVTNKLHHAIPQWMMVFLLVGCLSEYSHPTGNSREDNPSDSVSDKSNTVDLEPSHSFKDDQPNVQSKAKNQANEESKADEADAESHGVSVEALSSASEAELSLDSSTAEVSRADEGFAKELEMLYDSAMIVDGYNPTYPDDEDWHRDFPLPDGFRWTTNLREEVLASDYARKEGTYQLALLKMPTTYRIFGSDVSQDSSLFYRFSRHKMRMALVGVHPNSLSYIPELASFWAVNSEELSEFSYVRLHPKAKWSDSHPVTPGDLVFTKTFALSEHVGDVILKKLFTTKIKDIQDLGQGIVRIETFKKMAPLEMLHTLSSVSPVARHFHALDASWKTRHNSLIEPTTGPYALSLAYSKIPEGVGSSATLLFKRVKDWWADDLRYFKKTYNFLAVLWNFSPKTAYEDFPGPGIYYQLKGRLTARNLDPFNGLSFSKKILEDDHYYLRLGYWKKLIHTAKPLTGATSGIYLNTRDTHFSNPLVREAFIAALDLERPKALNSVRFAIKRVQNFSSGYGDYDHPEIKSSLYNPIKAQSLMKEAGYEKVDGVWTKDGEGMIINIITPAGTPINPYVVMLLKREGGKIPLIDKAKKAGFDIRFLPPATVFSESGTVKYQAVVVDGPMPVSPMPTHYFSYLHSSQGYADQREHKNYANLDDARMDELVGSYGESLSAGDKQQYSKEIIALVDELNIFIPTFHIQSTAMMVPTYLQHRVNFGTRLGFDPLIYSYGSDPIKAKIKDIKNWHVALDKEAGGGVIIDSVFQSP